MARNGHAEVVAACPLSENRTYRGQPISVAFDPERTLIAEERPRQGGSEYGLRAGDAELNRCQLRRAKVGSRQAGSYRSSERRWRKREAIAMSNDQKKIVSASAAEPLGAELERLLQPTRYFQHPCDVVRDAILTTAEKRPILSS